MSEHDAADGEGYTFVSIDGPARSGVRNVRSREARRSLPFNVGGN